MTRKGILINDPIVKDMNPTQWLFEFEGLYKADETRFEEYKIFSDIARRAFASMMGLDLMPIEEKTGVMGPDGEEIVRYRMPKENEYMPMIAYIGRDEVLSELSRKHKELEAQMAADKANVDSEDYDLGIEELEAFMGDDDSDIDFSESPEDFRKHMVWNSPTTKHYLDSLVSDISDKDKDLDESLSDESDIVLSEKKESKVYIE